MSSQTVRFSRRCIVFSSRCIFLLRKGHVLCKMRKMLDRTTILRLAVEAQLDPRTVQRAAEKGVSSLKSEFDRQRLRAAADKLAVKLTDKRRRRPR